MFNFLVFFFMQKTADEMLISDWSSDVSSSDLHYLEEAEQLCRNIGIIDHGTIVENTSMKQLLGQLHVETFLLDLKNDLSAAPQLLGYPARLLDGPLGREACRERGCQCV